MSVFMSLLAALLEIVGLVLGLYIWVLVIGAVLSWLVAFDVVNPRNRVVQGFGAFYYQVTEPLLRPIRRFVPIMGAIDLSPLVLILAIMFVQSFIRHLLVS